MRILHVVESLNLGGQERLILNLSSELLARGHEVAVTTLLPGGALRAELPEGMRVFDAPRSDGFDAMTLARVAASIARYRPDVVHTHNPSPMLRAVPAARALRVKRVIHTKHGANIYGPRSLHVARMVARAVNAFVTVSEGTAATARIRERVPSRLLHVVENGIPLDQFHPDQQARERLRHELGIPADAVVIGSVGRLAPEKDYPTLVRAAAPLLGPGVRLVLVGAGPSEEAIRAAIPPEARSFVVLTGRRKDVAQLLTTFDVFCLSSTTEGLPLVVPEAMAVGLPVVVTAVGGLPDVVGPDVGLLVPPSDPAALGRALGELVGDAERRKRLGEAARAQALARYSIASTCDRYEALYG